MRAWSKRWGGASLGERIAAGAFLFALCALIGFPFLMTVSVSLQTMGEVYQSAPVIIPASPQFGNYAAAMTNGNWPRYFYNSAVFTAYSLVVSLFINAMAGFAFARIPFRFREPLFLTMLIGMMIPSQVTLIPVFSMLKSVPLTGGNDILGQGGSGLINTYAGLILPYAAGSFGVFLCRQFYVSFPKELDDAALIDGCGRFGQFARIYLPLSGPLISSLSVLKFTGTWNEYMWPLVMTSGDAMRTVQVALTTYRNEAEIFWNQLMAATLVAGLPIYALFFFAQKQFVSGLLAGSVKG